jgi:hypothetical protein
MLVPLVTADSLPGRLGGFVSTGIVIASVAPLTSWVRLWIMMPRKGSLKTWRGLMAASCHWLDVNAPSGCMSTSAVSESRWF